MAWYDYLIGGLAGGPVGLGAAYLKNNQGAQNLLMGGTGMKAPTPEYRHQGQIEGLINQGLGRADQAAPQLNAGPQDQFRAGQMRQVGQLQGIASGQQKGAGELAAERQVQNALAGQFAGARMARGGNAGLANLNAQSNAAGIGLAGAGMGQQAAMGDQMNAQGLLTGALNAGRGQDLSLAGQNANLTQQGQQMNNQMYIQLLSQLTGMDANLLAAQFQAYQADKADKGLLGPLLSAGGQAAAGAFGA